MVEEQKNLTNKNEEIKFGNQEMTTKDDIGVLIEKMNIGIENERAGLLEEAMNLIDIYDSDPSDEIAIKKKAALENLLKKYGIIPNEEVQSIFDLFLKYVSNIINRDETEMGEQRLLIGFKKLRIISSVSDFLEEISRIRDEVYRITSNNFDSPENEEDAILDDKDVEKILKRTSGSNAGKKIKPGDVDDEDEEPFSAAQQAELLGESEDNLDEGGVEDVLENDEISEEVSDVGEIEDEFGDDGDNKVKIRSIFSRMDDDYIEKKAGEIIDSIIKSNEDDSLEPTKINVPIDLDDQDGLSGDEKEVAEIKSKEDHSSQVEPEPRIYKNFGDIVDLSKTYKYDADGNITNEQDYERDGATVTLSRINNFSELDIKDEQKFDEVFKKKTRQLWRNLAVHGVFGRKDGKPSLLNFSDLDGKSSIALLKKAGINTNKITYVEPGEHIAGFINVDTGNQHGLVMKSEEDGSVTVFMDHHSDESGGDTSAAMITYKTLTELGLLERDENLDKAVEFVTQMDNKTFPGAGNYFEDSYRNMLGLRRFVGFEELVEFFKDGKSPTDNLNDDELKKYGFINDKKNRSEEVKNSIERSFAQIEELEKNGFIVQSEKFGKIVVDIDGKIPAGFDAIVNKGFDTYINWSSNGKGFFITSKNEFPDDFKLDDGVKPRSTMLLKSRFDKTPSKTNIGDVLRAFLGADFNFEGGLKELVEKSDEREKDISSGLDAILDKYTDLSERKEVLELYLNKVDSQTDEGFLLQSEILIELQKIEDDEEIAKLEPLVKGKISKLPEEEKGDYSIRVESILSSFKNGVKSGSRVREELNMLDKELNKLKRKITSTNDSKIDDEAGADPELEDGENAKEINSEFDNYLEKRRNELMDKIRRGDKLTDEEKKEKIELNKKIIELRELTSRRNEILSEINSADKARKLELKEEKEAINKRINEILFEATKMELNDKGNELEGLKKRRKEILDEIDKGNISRKTELKDLNRRINDILFGVSPKKEDETDIGESKEKNAKDVLSEMGINISVNDIEAELDCIVEAEKVVLLEESYREIEELFKKSGVEFSDAERTELINEMEMVLNGALDAEAEREFSKLKYHKKVLAAGIGIGAVAGLVSAGARMMGAGILLNAGKVVAGFIAGGGAGLVRSKTREWLSPAIQKIREKNRGKLEEIRQQKKAEILKSENIKLVAVQTIKEAVLRKVSNAEDVKPDYVSNISEFLNANEGAWKSLDEKETQELVRSLAVLAEVSDENNKRLDKAVTSKVDGRLSDVKKSMIIGASIGGAASFAQTFSESPYAPTIVAGAISGIAMSGAIEAKMAERSNIKKERAIIDRINKAESGEMEMESEELKSYLESDKLNKYPLIREKAKNILMGRLLKDTRELNRGKIDELNEDVRKEFERKPWQKASSYLIGIGAGIATGLAGRIVFEHFRGEGPAEQAPSDKNENLEAVNKKVLESMDNISSEDREYIKEHGLEEYLAKKDSDELLKSLTEEKHSESESVLVSERHIKEGGVVSEDIAMASVEKYLDAQINSLKIGDEAKEAILKLPLNQKGDVFKEIKTLVPYNLDEAQAKAISENLGDPARLKQEVARIYGDINSVTAEVKDGDNFTKILRRALEHDGAEAKTKAAFIERVDKLTDGQVLRGVEITDENVNDLTQKAIDRLSAANVAGVDDKLGVKNLIYKGNVLKINSETGEWSVEKGGAVHAAQSVSEINLRENSTEIIAKKLGLSDEQIKHIQFEGGKTNLGERGFKIHIDDEVVHVRPDGHYTAEVDGQKIEGNLDDLDGDRIEKIDAQIEGARNPLRNEKWEKWNDYNIVQKNVEGIRGMSVNYIDFDRNGSVDRITLHSPYFGPLKSFDLQEGESIKSFINRAESDFKSFIKDKSDFLRDEKIVEQGGDFSKCGVDIYNENNNDLLEKADFINRYKDGGNLSDSMARKIKSMFATSEIFDDFKFTNPKFIAFYDSIDPEFYDNPGHVASLMEIKYGDTVAGINSFFDYTSALEKSLVESYDGVLEIPGTTADGGSCMVLLDIVKGKIGFYSENEEMNFGIKKTSLINGGKIKPDLPLNEKSRLEIMERLGDMGMEKKNLQEDVDLESSGLQEEVDMEN